MTLLPESSVSADSSGSPPRTTLGELAGLFLGLGVTAFGGPAVHLALMEEKVVRRRHWLSHQEFLDMYGATNLIPGPNSTEMAIHIGYRRRGIAGLLIAGSCFIFPAAIIVTVVAWAYVRFNHLPAVGGMLYGVKPIIVAVIAQALWNLRRAAMKSRLLTLVGILCLILSLFEFNELLVLFLGGFIVMAAPRVGHKKNVMQSLPLLAGAKWKFPLAAAATTSSAAGASGIFGTVALWPLFLFFLKVGAILFGSGYVLVAFIRADLVDRFHWLTSSQLLDAIAVGQVTPGPVFTTATFIGYILMAGPGPHGNVLRGIQGAMIATLGIFLPAFFFVAVTAPFLPLLRKSKPLAAFLDGLNVASLALMAAVTIFLLKDALFINHVFDYLALAMLLASALFLIRWKINSTWLVLAGMAIGLVKATLGH